MNISFRARRTAGAVVPGNRGAGRYRALSGLLVVVALFILIGASSEPVAAQDSTFRLGGNVVVEPGERILGDAVVMGGSVDVFGEVTGDVVAIGGAVRVSGSVLGDVIAVGGAVTLDAGAVVSGDVIAVGGRVQRDPAAVVRGQVNVVNIAEGFRFGAGAVAPWFAWTAFRYPAGIFYVLGLFALALLVAAVIPDKVHAVEAHMESNAGRSAVIGLITLVLLVPLSIILLITIIGAPLLWFGFFAAKMLGYVALVSLVGRKVTERFADEAAPVWQLVAGVAIVAVLRYVPLFGALFSFGATIWSLGAVLDTKFGTNRPWIPPRQA